MMAVLLTILLQPIAIVYSQFSVQPVSVVQAEGLEAVFECLYPGATFYGWGINSSFPTDENFPVDFLRSYARQNRPASLTIPALSQYNNTKILCEAVLEGESFPKVSKNATLQVQGSLGAVTSLTLAMEFTHTKTITISWEAPFSLNLTTAEPDIQYCVDVYNTSISAHISSECNITATSYFYFPHNPNPNNVYNFVITPLSNIPGALNGSAREVLGYIFSKPAVIPFELIAYTTNSMLSPITWEFPVNVFKMSPGHFPTSYSLHLESIDNIKHPSQCNCPATVETVEEIIRLTLQWCLDCSIRRHRVYNYTVLARNSGGESVSVPTQLSTHDVQLQAVTQFQSTMNTSNIRINYSYLLGSTSTGVFISVQSVANKSDIHFRAVPRESELTNLVLTMENVEGDQYNVVVYDLGEDQLPEEWPAGSQLANIDNSQLSDDMETVYASNLQPPTELLSQISEGKICINCSFPETLVKACVAIVHRFKTVNSSFLGNQLEIHSVNSSTAVECFQLDNKQEHAITVFALLQNGLERLPLITTVINVKENVTPTAEAEIENSTSNSVILLWSLTIIGSVLSLVLCLVLIITMAVCVSKCYQKSNLKKEITNAVTISQAMTSETELSQAQVPLDELTTNDAYNVIDASRVLKLRATSAHQNPSSSSTASKQSPPHIYDRPLFTGIGASI